MKRILLVALVAASIAIASDAQERISSLVVGVYHPGEKALLVPTFISSVNRYLRRYEPTLLSRDAAHVKMRADYDYLYEIELDVNSEDYEITVTLAEDVRREGKAQEIAAKLSTGVHKTMQNLLIREARARDRMDRERR